MSTLTVFAMTSKGLAVIDATQRAFPGLIEVVVSARDTDTHDDCYERIRSLCDSRGIVFIDRSAFVRVTTAFAMAVSWRWMIEASSVKLIVLHDSLLPRYRGFSPLVTAMINGDEEVGVTALYASKQYDRGDVIASSSMALRYPAKIKDVIERIAVNYVDLALQVCAQIASGRTPAATAQDESAATYSLWRDEEDYHIDWAMPAQRVKRTVDALGHPYKGAACWIDGRVARIVDAEVVDEVVIANREPGKVIFTESSKPVVVCGEGLLRIDKMVDDEGRSLLPLMRFRLRLNRP